MTKIIDVNCTTNEQIIREATDDELAQTQADQAVQAATKALAEARATEKAALLERLGITESEAKLLLS